MRTDISKAVFYSETNEGDEAPPDWMFSDPSVPQVYALEIAAVNLAKVFGWTLEYARRVASNPFTSAVIYGVMDGQSKAAKRGG